LLNVHILNVGHGDSIILEYETDGRRAYGLIDSNVRGEGEPRALTKLRYLGVSELSFVCLTHPHRDHYRGLYQILNEYRGRIAELYTFPVGGLLQARIKALAKKYQKLREIQDDPELTRSSLEFLQILKAADLEFRPNGNWIECTGEHSRIAPPGFAGVQIFTILPPRKAKGYYIQQIESGSLDVMHDVKDNDLSLAFHIIYCGKSIVLGGDGSFDNWLSHRRWNNRGGESVASGAVKLPHHGAHRDCHALVLGYLFDESDNRSAFISADGQSHPDEGVLRWLKEHGIRPYCTNLSKSAGATVRRLVNVEGVEPVLGRWINQLAEGQDVVQVCQGDITFSMAQGGRTRVVTQHNHLCGCGTEIDDLLGG
jgi:beta-lactamase superfamily II metal-dependent hydrolase